MKKLLTILALVMGISGAAFGQQINVQIDPDSTNPDSGTVSLTPLSSQTWGLTHNWMLNDSGVGRVLINSSQTTFDADPTLHYGFSANNYTDTTQTYTMTFTLPLSTTLLAGQEIQVSSSVSGSLSTGDTNTAQIGLAAGSSYIQQAYVGSVSPANDAGVDLINSSDASSLSFTPTLTAYSTSFGPYPAAGSPNTLTYVLSANASQLNVVTSFTLTGNDSATFSGAFLVSTVSTSVPEPSEEALLVAGLIILFVAVLRRTKSA